MYIEDAIVEFAGHVSDGSFFRKGRNAALTRHINENTWETKFLVSVAMRVCDGKPLSTEQSRCFLKIVQRAKSAGVLTDHDPREIDNLLASPQHRQSPYLSSNIPREVRYLGDNKLGFRCKRNDELIKEIKAIDKSKDFSWNDENATYFDYNAKLWIVSVTSNTFSSIIKVVGKYDFNADDAVLEYLALADSSRGKPSSFVYDEETNRIVVNICDNDILAMWCKRVVFGEVL